MAGGCQLVSEVKVVIFLGKFELVSKNLQSFIIIVKLGKDRVLKGGTFGIIYNNSETMKRLNSQGWYLGNSIITLVKKKIFKGGTFISIYDNG